MVIPKQYSHYIYINEPGQPTVDSNGDYTADEGTWELLCIGREETNGKGTTIETSDSKLYRFSSLVQMPVCTRKVHVGTRVIVSDEELTQEELLIYGSKGENVRDDQTARPGIVRIVGVCAKFDKGQLHCRMWL